mmetsp:Transcript_128008/g.362332  ORF Transcript_128008/g.362332 Transcript_128008/m.362332 type:complete len:217 (+) Transcript_128008:280-930(+)
MISSSASKPAALAGLCGSTASTNTPSPRLPSDWAAIFSPRYARGTFFLCSRLESAGARESLGIAKPMPSPKRARMLIIPTTSPSSLRRGPPLFPWFTAASVCSSGCRIQSKPVSPVERSRDEMMPSVQVFRRPSGWPRTTAQSPVRRLSEEPRDTSGSLAFGFSLVRTTATSMTSSASRTSHSRGARFPGKDTVTRSAPCTTWAFVTITPLAPSMQ